MGGVGIDPPNKRRVVVDGREWTVREIAEEAGVSLITVRVRLRQGIRGAALFAKRTTYERPPAVIDDVTPYAQDARCQALVADHPDGMCWAAIGYAFGVSPQAVQQTANKALRKLASAGLDVPEDYPEWAYPEAAE